MATASDLSYKAILKSNDCLSVISSEVFLKTGKRPLQKDVIADMATYIEASYNSLTNVWQGMYAPSLAVALKMLEYIRQYIPEMKIEDLYELVPADYEPPKKYRRKKTDSIG